MVIFVPAGFDATTIEPATLHLGGASLSGDGRSDGDDASPHVTNIRIEDVNGDGASRYGGRVHRGSPEVQRSHDSVAELWGQTTRGIPFSGTDFVQLVR